MKAQRWYLTEGQTLYVYDAPFPHRAVSVSIVPLSDLTYYRRTFHLRRAWTN